MVMIHLLESEIKAKGNWMYFIPNINCSCCILMKHFIIQYVTLERCPLVTGKRGSVKAIHRSVQVKAYQTLWEFLHAYSCRFGSYHSSVRWSISDSFRFNNRRLFSKKEKSSAGFLSQYYWSWTVLGKCIGNQVRYAVCYTTAKCWSIVTY